MEDAYGDFERFNTHKKPTSSFSFSEWKSLKSSHGESSPIDETHASTPASKIDGLKSNELIKFVLPTKVSFFAENVNDKLLLLLEPCFIKRTSHLGLGFLPYGL